MNELDYKIFIEDILDNNSSKNEYLQDGLFDNFYIPFLNYTKQEVKKILNEVVKQDILKVEEKSIIESVLCSTKNALIEVSIRTLIKELYDKKEEGLLIGDTSEERYDYYNDSFKDMNNIKKVFSKYKVLGYIFYKRIYNKITLLRESIQRLYKDIDKIRKEFDGKFDTLTSLVLDSGDTHNNGKSVLMFKFNNDDKLVYKPHTLQNDIALKNIYNYMNNLGKLKTTLKAINVISYSEYGWQEFAEYESCTDIEECRRYYYRIGAILSIALVLRTGDLHSENIIAAKDNPILIDLETLLTNPSGIDKEESLDLSYLLEINESVLGCYILPQNLENAAIDIDISGISGGEGHKSKNITYFKLINKGTDNIRFQKEYVITEKDKNKPSINGKDMEAVEFTNEVEDGFRDALYIIKNNKEEFLKICCENLKDGRYRQVFRPTYVYGRYLEASYNPKYLEKYEERTRLFNIIRGSQSNKKSRVENFLCDEEIKSLFNDDVPFFETDFSTLNVYANKSDTIENYFKTTLKSAVTEKISNIDKLDVEKEISYIRNSLITTQKNIFHNNAEQGEKISINKDDIKETLQSIGDFIEGRAIYREDKSSCTFSNLNPIGDRMLIGSMNASLYDGSGLVLFLYALGKELNDRRYINLGSKTLKGIEETKLSNIDNLPASAFSGLGSLVYLYYNLYRLTDEEKFNAKYVEYLKKLSEFDMSKDNILDIVGGVSGIIIVTLNIYLKTGDKLAAEVAKRCAEHLYEKLKEKESWNYLTGFAHGYSGLNLALMMAGSILDNEKYYNLALDLIEKEDSYYDEELCNWLDLRNEDRAALNYWCHGAPGILLSRVKMLKYLKDEDINKVYNCKAKSALKQFIKTGFNDSGNHSLCHGLSGNLEILRVIANEIQEEKLVIKCNEVFKELLSSMSSDGVKYGIYNALGLMGFMTGLSGIGYTVLRKINNNLPSALALDVL